MRAPERPFIDAHAHLRLDPAALQALLAAMDELGFERAAVVGGGIVTPLELSTNLATGTHVKRSFDNLELLKLVAPHARRILPFWFANPWEDASDYREHGFRFHGLKLGPAVHGVELGNARNTSYVRVAEELGHPVYLHCLDRDGMRVSDLVALAARFPDADFILGHGGTSQLDYHAVELIARSPNILFETSGAFTAVIKHAAQRLGRERVLFGSEFPLQDPRAELAKARCLGFDAETFRAYTSANMARLLRKARVETYLEGSAYVH